MTATRGPVPATPADSEVPSFADYVAVLRRRRGLVVFCTVVGLLLAVAYTVVGSTKVTSATTVLVNEIPGEVLPSSGRGTINMQTQVELANSSQVADRAAEELEVTPGRVKDASTASPAAESANVLVIRYTASDSATAQRGAEAVAREYLRLRGEIGTDNLDAALSALRAEATSLEQELAQLTETLATTPTGPAAVRAQLRSNQVSDRLASVQSELLRSETAVLPGRIIAEPTEPGDLSITGSLLTLFVGGIGGFIVGVLVAFTRDRLDRRVRALDDLRDLGMPDLGVVRGLPAPRRVVELASSDTYQDQMRAGMSVLTALERVGARTCLVVEPGRPDDPIAGSYTAVIAAVIAEAVPSVTVIAGNLRDDDVARVFRLGGHAGLREFCGSPDLPPEKVAVALDDVPGVTAVPAGAGDEPSMRILRSERFAKLLEVGRSRSDLVLLDAPPMGTAADALLLAADVDAVLLVLTPESDVDAVRESQLELDRLGTPIIGFVLVRPGRERRRED